MRKTHTPKDVGCFAELNVLVGNDFDPIAPWVEKIEKAARQWLDACLGKGLADRLLVINDEPEMPAIVAGLFSPFLQGEELITEIDKGGTCTPSPELEVKQAAIKDKGLFDVADLKRDMVETYRPSFLCHCHGPASLRFWWMWGGDSAIAN